MQIGIVGLGRMGSNVTRRLMAAGHACVAHDIHPDAVQALLRDPTYEAMQGRVADSGEGRWTLEAAIDTGTPGPVLATALFARFGSRGRGDFASRVLSAMRREFGGHEERGP